MGVATPCFKALQADYTRVGMNLKVDYRAGTESHLRSKIEKVEAHWAQAGESALAVVLRFNRPARISP